jgi:HSP20 family protein
MLDSFKHQLKDFGRELGCIWKSLSEGWHALSGRSSDPLARFFRNNKDITSPVNGALAACRRWSKLAGEVTGKIIMARPETPDMEQKYCHVMVEGNVIYLSVEKHLASRTHGVLYSIMERACGAFGRTLHRRVDVDQAASRCTKGVSSARRPKAGNESSKTITLS